VAPFLKNAAEAERSAPAIGVPVAWKELPRRKVFEGRMLRQGAAGTIRSSVTASVNIRHLRFKLTRLWKTGLGITALVVFESSRLLLNFKEFNALFDRGRVGTYEQINIGWAIDGGNGLMVPVIANAESKSPIEMVAQMTAQYERYMQGALAPADFLGGTFTVSDLSSEGVAHFQPLISQGQCAILGVGSEMDGEENERLSLTLSFDHQVTEGKRAAQFLRELTRRLGAHGAREDHPFDNPAAPVEPQCARCGRDSQALRELNGILLRTEYPAGYVCSACLVGK
jgi:hypothetical protein